MAPTANEQIRDAILQRQIYLEKYTQHVQSQITQLLDSTEGDVRAHIERALGALVTADGTFADFGTNTNAKLAALADQILSTRQEAIDNGFDFVGSDLTSLAPAEAKYVDNIINGVSPVTLDTVLPSATMLAAIGLSTPFEGRILSDWASTLGAADQQRIMDTINVGMATGKTTDNIVRDVLGTGVMNGADGVTEITRRDASSVVQTAIATTASDARGAYATANDDIIKQEMWVATLDGVTCEECAALDGRVFDAGEGDQPPAHYNCRCTRVPVLDGKAIGNRPYTAATEDALSGMNEEDRAQAVKDMTGTVPASVNYQEWLSGQSADFQDEVLGPHRGQMFRDGNFPLSRFVNRDGDLLTLDELNARGAASMFISPNIESGLTMQDAIDSINSARQAAVLDASDSVNGLLGIEGDQASVIGAWVDGAENSIAMNIAAGTDWETLRAAAAMKGELAEQKAVLLFQSGDGDAALSRFTLNGNLNDVHEELLQAGINQHTLVELPNGRIGVTVLSTDQASLDTLDRIGVDNGYKIDTQIGRGEFIGTALSDGTADDIARADAVNQYENVIKSYLASQPEDIAAGWDRVLADWRSTQTILPGIKAVGQEDADKVVAAWIARSPIQTVDDLFAGAAENDVALKDIGREIAASLPGVEFRAPGVKGMERTLQKLATRGAAGVTDVVRATFVPTDPAEIPAILDKLSAQFPIVDEGWRMTNMGYFDRPIKLLFPNGQIGEILIAPRELVVAKSDAGGGGHLLYKEARQLATGDPRLAELTAQQKQLYGDALHRLSPAWQHVVDKLRNVMQAA